MMFALTGILCLVTSATVLQSTISVNTETKYTYEISSEKHETNSMAKGIENLHLPKYAYITVIRGISRNLKKLLIA
jgi:hypothetical protein